MAAARAQQRGGLLARLRDARRDVSLVVAPDTPRGRALALGSLTVLAAVCALLTTAAGPSVAPSLTLAIPVVLGAVLLDRPQLRILNGLVALAFLAEVLDAGWHEVRPGAAVVLFIIGVLAVELARDRERLGLSTGRSELMLLELRDQLRRQGELPELPRGWNADVAQASAGGSTFGGDFFVATLTDEGKRLELALVDVSGKGVDAGTRALLLSGALGGLLGAVAPERFLEAANDYLLRQQWHEGFATALHLTIDLQSGHYRMSNAGHPPIAHYAGGSGRWRLVETEGTVLGLLPDATFGVAEGNLAPLDALLIYTDGLVEVPGRDLAVGIDRLLGGAELLIPRGFAGGANRLLETVEPSGTDDRAVVLLWRS